MAKPLIKVDFKKKPEEQPYLHNRWHPDIPMIAWVKPGDEFRVECLDWTGGQIKDDDNAKDVRDVNLSKVHYLSGPIGVKGAEPGDLLVVDLLDVGVLPESDWGFTGIFDRKNGGGFLVDQFPDARKACWHFSGLFASSRHIPGVEFAGITHPGLIGCLPSRELLDIWNKRVPTPKLNRWLREMETLHPPPLASGRRIRLRFMTQIKIRPPTFILSVSQPEGLGDDYLRFLTNRLRDDLGLPGVPIRLTMRKPRNPYVGSRKR